MKYSPSEILRKFVMRQNIEHLVVTSECAVWMNLTFWENVTRKSAAVKMWNHLQTVIVREHPNFRFVGVWARQGRGSWHIHGVCNMRLPIQWFRQMLARADFGPQCFLKEVDNRTESPKKIARYITGYCTDKNCLDPVEDKGVRRMIFVGKHVRILDMRYRSKLKQITAIGRQAAKEIEEDERKEWSHSQRSTTQPSYIKRAWESWGDWYRRNRDYWFQLGWELMSEQEQRVALLSCEYLQRYLATGQWSYV